ncbi:NAD(P)H-dependent oxidoreductase [Microcella humidisoli]|uniref:NAD(P)H-dependent oxidoreductase n=1 Tax=Microcella humidisoli TaxID=2963406 RepID=A0ABY5FUP4_9MICO|nr:NAD(P)H-dependent oxidoreductase [Microcella humidisoli]UTT61963.1 NAD(P)H-dependent oxidoreductase [Microcella humidisoli]
MHVLLVLDHPYGVGAGGDVPHRRSLVVAMLDAARDGLERAGHTHETIDLADLDPAMTDDDLVAWRRQTEPRADVAALQQRLAGADHLVLAFPVWWMSMPARTKGFLDRVLTPGFAFDEPVPGGRLHRRLHRLQGVTALVAMTTPSWLYTAWFGAPARRILDRGTFRLIGIPRVRWIAIDRSAQRGAASRQRALERVRRRFAALRPLTRQSASAVVSSS